MLDKLNLEFSSEFHDKKELTMKILLFILKKFFLFLLFVFTLRSDFLFDNRAFGDL